MTWIYVHIYKRRSNSALWKLNNYINRSINQYPFHYFVCFKRKIPYRSEPPINFIDNMVIFWWPSSADVNWNEFSNRISRYFVSFCSIFYSVFDEEEKTEWTVNQKGAASFFSRYQYKTGISRIKLVCFCRKQPF